jgi:hypothetical protein
VTTHATGPQELATRLIVRNDTLRVLRLFVMWLLTEEDVDAHESDSCLLCREVGNSSYGSGDGYDKLANSHTNSSHKEKVATSKPLHEIQSREGTQNVNAAVGLSG